MTRRQSFVTFLSPGTFCSEQTTKPIETWDPATAVRIGADVDERYGAKPYAFYFSESIVSDAVPDGEGGALTVQPKQVRKSGLYHLNGVIKTMVDFDPKKDSILLSNMRANAWPFVVETTNSYKHVAPFLAEDFIVDASGKVTERGDDPKYTARRAHAKRLSESA